MKLPIGSQLTKLKNNHMAENKPGWIKLHRSLLDWEWWDDHNATRLLIYLLVSVNYEKKKWMGQTINPGQIVTSWEKLSDATGLTIRQCRTSMDKLEKSRQITRKATNKWQAITLMKWDKLQGEDVKCDKPVTSQRQTNDKPATTTKESTTSSTKEYKEINVDVFSEIISKMNLAFGKQLREMTPFERSGFTARFEQGYTPEDIFRVIEVLKNDEWCKSKKYIHCTPEYISKLETIQKYLISAEKIAEQVKRKTPEEIFYENVMKQVPDHYKNKEQ